MATCKRRNNTYCVIYQYRTSAGKVKQKWETYMTELEAVQRKALIDYFQANKQYDEIRRLATEYTQTRAIEKCASKIARDNPEVTATPQVNSEENLTRTYREFMEKFLPIYARKQNFSPKTYDSYVSMLNTHILPYFGDWVMSAITPQAIDDFIDHLRRTPCRGYKSHGRIASEIPTLSSPTIKKCYNILKVGFPTAKRWGYIREIPATTAPSEKYRKRKAWSSTTIMEALNSMRDDPLLHLAVHLGFVCSLRSGEVAGIDANSVNPQDHSLWITQILERVSDDSLAQLPKERIVYVFPKQTSVSKSSLVLKAPKTEGSYRKQYLTGPLLDEIMQRLLVIEQNKAILGTAYHSNQEFQYTSQAYFSLTQAHGITPSMSRKGNPYDNAMSEIFFSIPKTKCIHCHKPVTFSEADEVIDRYIHFDNHERIQLRTGEALLAQRLST